MEPTHAADSKAAQQYLIDPFFAPEPSDETGPGTHFRSTFGPAASDTSLPSPPNSANSKEPSVQRHIPGPDTIDRLDSINGKYHHEGPYDAALLARNTSWKNSPLAALEDSNREAIKATPVENIRDAVERHVPIDGVAIVPPGMPDRFGRTYDYEEGDDMMLHNGGNYRRWPGIGKGEPSYSLDEAMKRHKISSKGDGIEMTTRPRNKSDVTYQYRGHYLDPNDAGYGGEQRYNDWGVGSSGISRSRSTGHKMTEGLKKRLGGIGRKHKERAE
ncbi:putative pal1 cell morphology protein [Neofusicoccum parvum UCRNP2]|uniref:Putative pal1 cell morphology protein n=1 Tax=Botryosphaeria parva (strain UCR-NP2) TaxID=1287680 RepID=R1GL57_BOTPV|nr:putative pal1 cell morphology protein [Neofusicoccum parvum UCRNP2]